MKIAVFSDVHSCHSKMAAVFEDMEKYQIDQFVCLGDIIGYGDKPEETINLLMEKKVVSVRGNHELAMFNRQYLECFPKAIKQPLLDNIAVISNRSVRYLEDTPSYLKMTNTHFVHGTPPDKITTYIYDVTDYYLKSLFNNSKEQVFFTGHTHKLKLITYKDRIVLRQRITENCTIPLEKNQKYLLNVGSIGFSRDDFKASKYAIYDSEKNQVMVRMVEHGKRN
ncbi:MAG: metallophosphoesterase family protein [Deltaproteobacteria bacterium]|nr:metallophosphoesterase family protein [Deltaproteobacteria bacterium]